MTNDSISKLDQIALCYDKMSCHLPVNEKKWVESLGGSIFVSKYLKENNPTIKIRLRKWNELTFQVVSLKGLTDL